MYVFLWKAWPFSLSLFNNLPSNPAKNLDSTGNKDPFLTAMSINKNDEKNLSGNETMIVMSLKSNIREFP